MIKKKKNYYFIRNKSQILNPNISNSNVELKHIKINPTIINV
jgi:hypothetical protein